MVNHTPQIITLTDAYLQAANRLQCESQRGSQATSTSQIGDLGVSNSSFASVHTGDFWRCEVIAGSASECIEGMSRSSAMTFSRCRLLPIWCCTAFGTRQDAERGSATMLLSSAPMSLMRSEVFRIRVRFGLLLCLQPWRAAKMFPLLVHLGIDPGASENPSCAMSSSSSLVSISTSNQALGADLPSQNKPRELGETVGRGGDIGESSASSGNFSWNALFTGMKGIAAPLGGGGGGE